MDAMLGAKLNEWTPHVLPTLVVARSLHPAPKGIFGLRLERLEGRESVTLVLQESDHPETRSVADKSHPVGVALWSRNGQGALEVRMDEGEPHKFSRGKTRNGMVIELTS